MGDDMQGPILRTVAAYAFGVRIIQSGAAGLQGSRDGIVGVAHFFPDRGEVLEKAGMLQA